MLSIDQNSHSLWDVLPKLQALCRRGVAVKHYVEDVDVAFTAIGVMPGGPLRLARERYHHAGGSDWGAALFYTQFLGRQAVDLRDWEPYTGMKTSALAKALGRGIEDVYAEFSPSDNWQLIGPSYVGDRDHHRTVGDLAAYEAAPFVREIFDRAQADATAAFPDPAARARTAAWFAAERARVEALLAGGAERLVDLYRLWLARHVAAADPTGDPCTRQAVGLAMSSELLTLDRECCGVLDIFTKDYQPAAAVYNRAMVEAQVGLHALNLNAGELPFFAVMDFAGHHVRTACFLEGRSIRVGRLTLPLRRDGSLPLEELASSGVECLAGKAALLVLQVRVGPRGDGLALPYRGSVYVPATHRLEVLLRQEGLLREPVAPITRVRFRLLDRLSDLKTTIHPPPHVAWAMGREVPAAELAASWQAIAADAAARLEALRTPAGRRAAQRAESPQLGAEIDALDARRRDLAAHDPKSAEIREASHQSRRLHSRLLETLLRRIDRDWQLRDLDYYDSRGALLPWCTALGGQDFYDSVIARAEVYEEAAGNNQ